MSSLLNSARWVGISQASKIVCQLLSVVILARILPPADYGVMAMATVVITLAGMLREMGTGTAVIQKKELTQSSTSTIFWLNIAMGSALAMILATSSVVISQFFKEPQLVGVLITLSVLFPITSSTTIHQALLERRSEFKTLAVMDVLTQFSGLALAIVAAMNGAGVYSFVVPAISTAVISSIWLWRKSQWRPSFVWNNQDFREILGFTGNLTGFNFINYFARNADSIIIGRMLGATLLGSYSLAYKLMLFPVQNLSWVVSRIMLPALSRLQDKQEEATALYFKSLLMIVTITAPLMLGLWVLREPFIHLAFGNKWNLVIGLLAWLAPVGLLQSIISTSGTVLTAYGRTDLMLRLGIFSTTLFVTGFWLGAFYGLTGVAVSYFIANVINLFVSGFFTLGVLNARVKDFVNYLKAPILSAVVMVIAISISSFYIDRYWASFAYVNLLKVGFGTALGVAVYFLVLTLVFKQSLKPLLKIVRPS